MISAHLILSSGHSSHIHSNNAEDPIGLMEIDQPSILVAAAISSQYQGSSSYPEVMTTSYRSSSLKSVDKDTAAAPEKTINDSPFILTGQPPSANEPEDTVYSDVDTEAQGHLTDDGYVPDAEATGEEKMKKRRVIDDGYVPDAEATEEESSKPFGVGTKAVQKRDVRFEAVLETRVNAPMTSSPVEPAANQSIDDGYLPDGALTEEEKQDHHERRFRNIEEGYLPDDHTTATDDDTVERRRRSPHRKISPTEVDGTIDTGKCSNLSFLFEKDSLLSHYFMCEFRLFTIGCRRHRGRAIRRGKSRCKLRVGACCHCSCYSKGQKRCIRHCKQGLIGNGKNH